MPRSSINPAMWVPKLKASIRQRWNTLREPRIGIMLHYDGSSADIPGVDWVAYDPRAGGSYNWMTTDIGQEVDIVPDDRRAWHAGKCRVSSELEAAGLLYRDANSAFYGIAITATDGDQVTPAAFDAVVRRCVTLFRRHGWVDGRRITGHDREAWPRGRKIDPTGSGRSPVLSVPKVRDAVKRLLSDGG